MHNKILSFISVFLLLFSQISAPLVVYAQEATPAASETSVPLPDSTPIPSPTSDVTTDLSPTPSPQPSQTPAPSLEPSPTPAPSLDESLTTLPTTQSASIDTSSTENQSSSILAPPLFQTNSDGSFTTTNPVVLNQTYKASQNDKVAVAFQKLPGNPGKLTIKEITLTDEQVAETNALSKVAYDITSTMADGTFEYTLTLPTPKTDNVEVKASEDGQTFVTLGGVTAQTDTLTITGLNHFTVFVLTASPASITDGMLSVIADTYVRQDAATNNFGTDTSMNVYSQTTNKNRRAGEH